MDPSQARTHTADVSTPNTVSGGSDRSAGECSNRIRTGGSAADVDDGVRVRIWLDPKSDG